MTKGMPCGAIFCLLAVPSALVASAQVTQSAANSSDAAKRGNEVLLAAAKAAGGGERLNSVATLAIEEKGKIITAQGDTSLAVKWIVAYPDRSHGEVLYGDQDVVQVCDGTSAWLQFSQGIRDTTPVISEFKRGISLFGGGWGIYEQVLAGRMNGQFIGETEIDGKKMLGVAVEGAFSSPAKLALSPVANLSDERPSIISR